MAGEESEQIPVENSQNTEDGTEEKSQTQDQNANDRLLKLPLSRIKHIMKSDPDVTLASQEAVVTLAKATELFIQMVAKDAVGGTLHSKRKTLQRKDLDGIVDAKDCYAFLEGTLD